MRPKCDRYHRRLTFSRLSLNDRPHVVPVQQLQHLEPYKIIDRVPQNPTDSSFFSLFKCHFLRYTGNPISRQIWKIIKNPKISQVSSLIWICIQESISVVAPFGKALNSLGGPRERPSGNAFSASANTRIADANPVKSEYLTDWHQRKQWSSKSDWSSCKPWWIVRFAELGNPELWSPSGNPRGLLENLPSGYFHRELVRLKPMFFFWGLGCSP